MNPKLTDEISKIEKLYLTFMKKEMQYAASLAKKTLLDNKNYATKGLFNSISGGVEISGSRIIASFGANTTYAKDVETGKSETTPTYKAIQEWVRTKIRLGHIQLEKKAINTFAYFVTKKIEKTGRTTNTKPYLKPAYEQLLETIKSDFPLEVK